MSSNEQDKPLPALLCWSSPQVQSGTAPLVPPSLLERHAAALPEYSDVALSYQTTRQQGTTLLRQNCNYSVP